jgi:uncharacterized membrane protein
MNDRRTPSPQHQAIRGFFRVAGPITALVGLFLIIVAMVSFFSSMGSFEPPRYFWCAFVGMPLLFVGIVMTKAGYLGAIYRYFAAEATPVATDAFNDMAEGAQPGLRAAARSITEGVEEGRKPRD